MFSRITLLALSLFASICAFSRSFPKPQFNGMYFQWGYNREIYTRNDIRFQNGDAYDFTIHDVKGHDKPDFEGFWESPLDITIPQNSFRIGVYLNKQQSWAIELNFDHAKYVMPNDKSYYVSGHVAGVPLDKDTIVTRRFVGFEHTDGANFYHINYVHQKYLIEGPKFGRLSYLLKGGAGIVLPRSDGRMMGERFDNKYHVAGYILSAEAGMRYYPLRNFFLELNLKGGFANYFDVRTVGGGKAAHKFGYGEVIGLVGYDLLFGRKRVRS
jgi:hypothetical protein